MLNSKSAILVFGIFGVVVAPLLEEIIFRGFPLSGLFRNWRIAFGDSDDGFRRCSDRFFG
jgi:membrane protease YdiL (CAAX protease family)